MPMIKDTRSAALQTSKNIVGQGIPLAATTIGRVRFVKSAAAARISELLNISLATDIGYKLESWLGKTFNEGIPSIYDRAADSAYNAGIASGGGQLHRLYDGSHSISGMWSTVREALPDDSLVQETWGFATAYLKDLSSHVGMPFFTMSPESYRTVSEGLSGTFGISKGWLQDALHTNAVEVMGIAFGALALTLNWKKEDIATFSRLAGSYAVVAILSANTLLGIIALIALARAYMQVRKRTGYKTVGAQFAKGSVGTGAILGLLKLTPPVIWIPLMVTFCLGVLLAKTGGANAIREVVMKLSGDLGSAVRSVLGTDDVGAELWRG